MNNLKELIPAEAHSYSSTEIRAEGRRFVDQFGRSLILHGASVSGLSKLPISNVGSHVKDSVPISFIGRPFPLSSAREHLNRLKTWGLTFIRFVVTWESIEHEGPGIYDFEYMDYLKELLLLFEEYGMLVYLDVHQDVWSRMTGGSGAPEWTLSIAGLKVEEFKATASSHTHHANLEAEDQPSSVWPSGYCKLAAASMATLFWAGNIFAPNRKVDRKLHHTGAIASPDGTDLVGLQDFLQNSLIEAFGVLSDKLADVKAIIGIEVANEAHRGYIELLSPYSWDFNCDLAIGFFPSPLQSFALGAGHAVKVDVYAASFPVTKKSHSVLFSPPRSVWGDSGCPWEQEGVWTWRESKLEEGEGEAIPLKCDYFTKHPETGVQVEWYRDFYWPFCQKFEERVGRLNPKWLTMVGPIPNELCPPWSESRQPRRLVYSPHFYDLQALFSKKLGEMTANVQGLSRGMFILNGLYFGRSGLKKNYELQIRNIINAGYRSIGEIPCVMGETGIPFDLNEKEAFETGDYKYQERMLDGIISALEQNFVGYNLWNYSPLNTHENGDGWNKEDFSFFSTSGITSEALRNASSDAERLNIGARALNAFERPYAAKIAGIPIYTRYNMDTLEFRLRFRNPLGSNNTIDYDQLTASTQNPRLDVGEITSKITEIFLPRRLYDTEQLRVVISTGDGNWKYDPQHQTLCFTHVNTTPGFTHSIEISVSRSEKDFVLFWQLALSFLIVVFAIYFNM